jgi:hypothetical protein
MEEKFDFLLSAAVYVDAVKLTEVEIFEPLVETEVLLVEK